MQKELLAEHLRRYHPGALCAATSRELERTFSIKAQSFGSLSISCAGPGSDCQQLQRLFLRRHRAGGAGNHWHLTCRISGIAAAIHGLNRSLEQFDTDQTRLP